MAGRDGDRPVPAVRKLELQLVTACNLRCTYCANDPDVRDAPPRFMPLEMVERCLDRLRPEIVSLTGGEVALAGDRVLSALELARRYGARPVISSNLTVFRPADLDRLVEVGGVTGFFSSCNDLDDAMTLAVRGGRPAERRRLLENLAHIARRGWPLSVETILLRDTVGRLVELHRLLADLGVRQHRIEFLTPVGHASWGLMPDFEEVADALERLYAQRARDCHLELTCCPITPCSPLAERLFPRDDPGVSAYHCTDGKDLCYVTAGGDMVPCYAFTCRPAPGNVGREDPRRIWEESPVFLRVRREAPPACEGCRIATSRPGVTCTNGCWAMLLMGTGGLTQLCWEFAVAARESALSGAGPGRLPVRRLEEVAGTGAHP
ncbi:MAG: radical SAM protein [Acetobacteraceae bacterium]|nr:radical SAM protein [Acetobacteraceae bacterium]